MLSSKSRDRKLGNFDAPLHPMDPQSNYAAGDLTSKDDYTRVAVLDFILGVTNLDQFIVLFINEIKINRYRGFVRLNICEQTKPNENKILFSWFYRKFDVYLVAVYDGFSLYECGKGGAYRWLRSTQLTGFTERYSDLFAKNDKASGEKEENNEKEKKCKRSNKCFSWFNSGDGYVVALRDGIFLHGSRKHQWVAPKNLRGYWRDYGEVFLKGQGASENNKKKGDIKKKVKKSALYGVVLSSAKFIEAVCQVKDNVGQPLKWINSFGYFSVMIAEAGRFKWVRKISRDVMLNGKTVVLGEGEYEWGSYVPMIWAEASKQVHRIKGDLSLLETEVVCPPYTLGGAEEMSTNPRAAYHALSLIAWDEKDIINANCEKDLIEPHLSLAQKMAIGSLDSDQPGDQLLNQVPKDEKDIINAKCEKDLIEPHLSLAQRMAIVRRILNQVPKDVRERISTMYRKRISMRYIFDTFDYTCGKVLAKFNDSRNARHVGLENQGCTSYLNALLQTLHNLPNFRKAVYKIPTTNSLNIPAALKWIFYYLQASPISVSTKVFTNALGLDPNESIELNDVQSFSRYLFQKLDVLMEETGVDGTIPHLFEGKMHHSDGTEHESSYFDLQLDVKGCKDVYASFDEYVRLHNVRFTEFPRVLLLYLTRIQYDEGLERTVKIDYPYEFPVVLDLDKDNRKYLSPSADPSVHNLYTLHSVSVHRGEPSGGHCYAYIRPTLEDQWFKYDDTCVKEEDIKTAMNELYGRNDEFVQESSWTRSTPYLLVYMRDSEKDDIMCELERTDIPEPPTLLDLDLELWCKIFGVSEKNIRKC